VEVVKGTKIKPLNYIVGVVNELASVRADAPKPKESGPQWAKKFDAEYFEILAHGGTGTLDLDPLLFSLNGLLNSPPKKPFKCCPTKETFIKRLKELFTLKSLVWLGILINNGVEIYALFLLLCYAVGDPSILLIIFFFVLSIFIVIAF